MRCHRSANVALTALLAMVQESAKDGKISVAVVARIAHTIMDDAGPLTDFYLRSEHGCQAAWALAETERHRKDYLGRLLVEPFVHLLGRPEGIERNRLVQYLAGMRMMLGEEVFADLTSRAVLLAKTHRVPEGYVDWDGFYNDESAKLILEQVLVTVARSFRRFEPRKDWFLIMLNSVTGAVSVGSTAFVPKRADEKVQFVFSDSHLARLLKALFASVRLDSFDEARTEAFKTRWGTSPKKVFGDFFVELLALEQNAGIRGKANGR